MNWLPLGNIETDCELNSQKDDLIFDFSHIVLKFVKTIFEIALLNLIIFKGNLDELKPQSSE